MTDTPGGSRGDPLGPVQEAAPPDVPDRPRQPLQRSLIPRRYRGFIPLVIILLLMAGLFLGPMLFKEGTGDAEPIPFPALSGTATPTTPPATVSRPTPAGTQVTVTPTQPGPADFTLTTSPVSASAGPGETVIYTMVIDGKNGFASPVHLELTATALFVTRRYDFGTYNPPFPQTIRYPFVVPDYLPSGVTVDGVLRATSGDLVHENRLRLEVE